MPNEGADSLHSATRSAFVRLFPAVNDLAVAESSRESQSPCLVRKRERADGHRATPVEAKFAIPLSDGLDVMP
jgi:hypothetical protein